MCLSLEPGVKPEDAIKTAKEDITCYKILKSYWHRSVDDKEILKSLYQDFDYVMGRKYQRKPELGLGFILCPGYPEYNTLDRYEVHGLVGVTILGWWRLNVQYQRVASTWKPMLFMLLIP